ncbi:MAG: translation initiation factor IF-3 [Raineya sp.]|nr:translation initiation factor IF-3 [Raineya sp.]
MNPRTPYRKGKEEELFRINEKIRVSQVRLVGENVEVGVYDIKDALNIAQEQGLDLVEINAKSDPPICRVVDYSKFKYEQKKKQKEMKAKAQKTVVKEIRFGPNTDDHDFNFKLKHAENFLKEGSKVRAYVQFVGRTIVFKERGEEILKKFIEQLEDFGKPEHALQMEGKKMIVIIAPATKSKK